MGRCWLILIYTSPAVRRNKSKSRRKKRMTKKRTKATLTKRRCKAVKKWFLPFSRARLPLLTKSKWSRKWMRSGDVTFPGYWLGFLRKPSRVRGCIVGLRHSQRHSLGLPSIQEQLDLCLCFPVLFWLRMCLFQFLGRRVNFLFNLSDWIGILIFKSLVPHYSNSLLPVWIFLCASVFVDQENEFAFFDSQNAGSTNITASKTENRLGDHNPVLSLL